jgi:DNA-binding NtrC family response regulator
MSQPDPRPPETSPVARPPGTAGGKPTGSILLIDDDSRWAARLQAALQKRGHRVHVLAQAEEGLDLLDSGDFDLVLLDNQLPGMSGMEFLDALERRRITLPVILVTGYASADTVMEAICLGALDHIDKDTLDRFLERLEPVLRKALDVKSLPPDSGPCAISVNAEEDALCGMSPCMQEVYKKIGLVARDDQAVLIQGETGTGKELVARAIHTKSLHRRDNLFVPFNCAAISDHLWESQLFGHEKGAFTGASNLRKGLFEHAHGGTLFLDEIGDMPLPLQAKLLRVLERKEVQRMGSNELIKVDVRLVSATNRDLAAAVCEGIFRKDLFYRLTQQSICLPPLRERGDDMERLAQGFVARAAAARNLPRPRLEDDALAALRAYPWPGNVRELKSVMESAVNNCRGAPIRAAHLNLPGPPPSASPRGGPTEAEALDGLRQAVRWAWDSGHKDLWPLLRDRLMRELVQHALAELGNNQVQAAQRLGIARNTLRKYLDEHGHTPPPPATS